MADFFLSGCDGLAGLFGRMMATKLAAAVFGDVFVPGYAGRTRPSLHFTTIPYCHSVKVRTWLKLKLRPSATATARFV